MIAPKHLIQAGIALQLHILICIVLHQHSVSVGRRLVFLVEVVIIEPISFIRWHEIDLIFLITRIFIVFSASYMKLIQFFPLFYDGFHLPY